MNISTDIIEGSIVIKIGHILSQTYPQNYSRLFQNLIEKK